MGGESMKKIDLEDTISFVKDYLDLMWVIHTHYESVIDADEITKYKIGIQTFLLAAIEQIKSLYTVQESE